MGFDVTLVEPTDLFGAAFSGLFSGVVVSNEMICPGLFGTPDVSNRTVEFEPFSLALVAEQRKNNTLSDR